MARKATYLYRVKASLPGKLSDTTYVYARNKLAAVSGVKQLKPEWKFAHFDAICFAEADYDLHPELFKPLTKEEVKMVTDGGYAKADSYSRRKDTNLNLIEQGEFVPVDKE